ncbi:MAG TPA: glycosyltransferase family 4 protein [Desulfomonilaceae bacterium]|nr:glycosyltransferase family 4 protein [Desulfomonilaceae bacterium]HVN83149.1 glycosyltransferase family 4 protein [Terriglobia bacterium]
MTTSMACVWRWEKSNSGLLPPMESPITVLHLVHTVGWGGVETGIVKWLRKIDAARFPIRLACFANSGGTEAPFVDFIRNEGWPIHMIPWGRHKPFVKAARAVARTIRENHIQILHTHNWYADMVGAMVARIVPVKTVTTLYMWSDLDWRRNFLQQLDKIAVRFFDQITVHCDYTFRRTVEMGLARPEELRKLISGFELRNGQLSPCEREERRRQRGISADMPLLVYVGRFHPEKAQDQLLRIFGRVVTQCPGARLWILGEGPLEGELKALSKVLAIDHAVSFLGFVPEPFELLALADILVHPSNIEGVSQAIGEGMAAGMPIVVSDVGGLREIMTPGINGVMVPPGDEEAFAQAVLDLIENRERRAQLGNAARRFIKEQYSIEIAVRELEDTYSEVARK